MTTEAGPEVGSSPIRDQVGEMAGTAREQAGEMLAHTRAETRDLINELWVTMQEQSQTQRGRMAGMLGGIEQELQNMADQGGGSGVATEAVRQVAVRMRKLQDYLEGPNDILGDLRSFARRRPGTFLLAAAAAGVVAGRITRSTSARSSGKGLMGGLPGGHDTSAPGEIDVRESTISEPVGGRPAGSEGDPAALRGAAPAPAGPAQAQAPTPAPDAFGRTGTPQAPGEWEGL